MRWGRLPPRMNAPEAHKCAERHLIEPPPLEKGEDKKERSKFPPFEKGGPGGIFTVKSPKTPFFVILAKAGIQCF